jgi:hypothetical protein
MGRWVGGLVFTAILANPTLALAGQTAVRGAAPELARAIEDASEQSATFQQLVAAIADAGGLVYVHHGTCGRNVRACLVLDIDRAGPFRILSIRVDKRKQGGDLMVAIGHELHHVLEVLREPGAVDSTTIRLFYERVAPTERLSFETQGAIETELKVAGDLRQWRRVQRATPDGRTSR